MEICKLCNEPLLKEATVTLGAKGCAGILKASEQRQSDVATNPGDVVHTKCRKEYINPKVIEQHNRKRAGDSLERDSRCTLRSSETLFNYKRDCLFCGCTDPYEGRRLENKLIQVRTMDFRETILKACETFSNEWVDTVRKRVLFCQDLPAADAVYHQICNVNFRTGKCIPHHFMSKDKPNEAKCKRLSGRPKDLIRGEAFLQVAEYLEQNDDEQITINDLIEVMKEFTKVEDCDPYSSTYMTTKIKEHFGDRILITEINGKNNVVTFRVTASKILHDFHRQQQLGTKDEANYIIETAAKLIKSHIKDIQQSKDTYPDYDAVSSVEKGMDYLPESLRTFLNGLFVGKHIQAKLASVGQAIMQATRPRVLLAPLQVGLGVQLHHHFQSRFLIDTLHRHGFCCSYSEVKKFERSSAMMQGTDIPNCTPDHFLQYAADNVDHNIRTIDGNKTFHGMGIIVGITPRTNTTRPVKRLNVTAEDIAAVGRISITHFAHDQVIKTILYEHLDNPNIEKPLTKIDLLWESSLLFKASRPLWSGFMQMVYKGAHPGESSVMFLPMIDMDPNDSSCIYSTLQFVCSHAVQYNATPIITFDQPLWWKANMIVDNEPEGSALHSVVVRLGGFHIEMSYLGCIGHLMSGSGLRNVLELVYADNAVGHMLSGKAVARAVRGHLLINSALNALLSARVLDLDIPAEDDEEESATPAAPAEPVHVASNIHVTIPPDETIPSVSHQIMSPADDDVQKLTELMSSLLNGSVTVAEVESNEVLIRFGKSIAKEKNTLRLLKTCRLWMQYLDMVDLLRNFIKGERTGNWELHIQSLYDMLPYFAAAGHNMYLKSVHLYLQKMCKLQEQHPAVYKHFVDGLHVIRRSDRPWAGLSTDLIIEQCLMRSVKMTGGLTRGRGMTETQRLVWVLSTPACAEMNNAMQEFTALQYTTSEQHKDSASARTKKDVTDSQVILQYLAQRNLFCNEPSFRNIATGVLADSTVTACDAKDIGEKIQEGMEGQAVSSYSFKKKDQAVTMDVKSTVKIRDEEVHVDGQLIFQRLVTAGTKCDDLLSVFSFELCTYPPALFESKYSMRPANKATLADALWTSEVAASPRPTGDVRYILDGGALLHRIPWTKGATWESICTQYKNYVARRYGKAVIVFDGYTDDPSTKDCTHLRRNGGSIASDVHFTSTMTLQTRKNEFLSNKNNKQRFIHMLSRRLEQSGCDVHHAKGDADQLIVQTTIDSSSIHNTVLIGEDTDLLVLLCHHSRNTTHDIFFTSEQKVNARKPPRCWNIRRTRSVLGDDVCENILFVHAILGCDTTSGVFGLGKKVALEHIKTKAIFLEKAAIFMKQGASKEEVTAAGECALVSLYGGRLGESINDLRLRRFYEKASSRTSAVQPQSLPPTSAATKYHSLRTYLQVQVWIGESNHLPPDEWGWKVVNRQMLPVLTDIAPAPQELLEIIRCHCKSGCNTMRCSCRKNGMDCSTACGECRGVCSNLSASVTDSESDDD